METGRQQFLTETLRETALSRPGQTAYTFLDGAGGAARLNHGDLDRKALAIAAQLQQLGGAGRRALLLYPPGLEFVAAFLGCLYGGIVAVPAYPPTSERTLPRLLAIARDARPALALTTTEMLGKLQPLAARLPGLGAVAWVATDQTATDLAEEWRDPRSGLDALAFLQYTSGSTASPKGVMVSHGNLLHNEEMIRRAFGQSAESVIVGWLPLYHDMGLIGNVLQPLYLGAQCILMTPAVFLQRPLSWLEAISRFRATTSGAPNFAYDLCVRKIGDEQRAGLDLASWEVAFNGAEPVRPETLERFAQTFAPQGFRRDAFYPCYGLAEATLFVSGGGKGNPPVVAAFDSSALERHEVVPSPAAAPGGRSLMGCGRPWMEQRVEIVDPESGRRASAGQVGEIWLSGPSVAQGYWGQPEATERDFRARLADTGEGPFLRTGDLGFRRGGELFVTGRLKDLLILRGRNLYPQDIEQTVERSHPALRRGCGAAFAVEFGDEERLVVVQELDAHRRDEAGAALEALRRAVAEEHEAQVHQAVLVRAGTIPKTSSGKIQRHAARAAFLAGTLVVEAASALQAASEAEAEGGIDREALLALPDAEREAALRSALRARVARALRIFPAELREDRPLTAYGLDSLAAIEIQHEMEAAFGVAPPVTALLQGATLGELAALAMGGLASAPARPTQATSTVFPLSQGQRALWYLDRLAPGNAAYILAGAGRIRGVDAAAVGGALAKLIERHAALRTVVETDGGGGEPCQRVREAIEPPFHVEDATSWNAEEWQRRLEEEAYRPFDLGQGPPLRAILFHRPGGEEILLLAVHHLAADFWSLEVLLQELAALTRSAAGLEPLSATYAEYVENERQMLAGPRGESLLAFWREQLGGELPQLDLPADRLRPRFQSFAGGVQARRFDRDLSQRLKALGRERDATPYMTLLAAFCGLLHRYSQQDDLLVGSPTSGRSSARMAGLVGYFVNPVVVRADLAGEPSFGELLGRLRRTVLDAFAHQELPFPVLAQHRAAAGHDPSRSPVFQTMFVFLRDRRSGPQGLAAAALGEAGARIDLDGLEIETLGLAPRGSQFDLTLWMAERQDAFHACLQFNTDLFDPPTMARALAQLAALLAAVAADPDAPLSALPLLSGTEWQQLVAEWTDPPDAVSEGACLHQLFESQAARTPQAVAVVAADRVLTYGELNRLAGRLAEHLGSLGVGPEVVVGILTRRSPEMLIAMLATLKAGGAYLPLDPAYPKERLAFMAEDSRMAVVLTDDAAARFAPPGVRQVSVAGLDRRERDGAFQSGVGPGNLAYVIYTSGSTGRPKGVAIEHRSAVALAGWAVRSFPPEDLAGVLASTSICFDLSVFELFTPLACGGSVVLVDNALALPAAGAAQQVTLVNTVPSAMAELVAEGGLPASLRTVNLAGEPLARGLVEQLAERLPAARILNLYGPSEDTTYSTCAVIASWLPQAPAIGRPIDGTRAYLLDRHLRPVPVGVPGEIALAGSGLARGYLGRPELTAERFLPDPFAAEPGARLYRTGDLARHLPSGEIRFLGRIDHQVKVRGFRIELGEIEAVLGEHPAVREAVVAVAGEPASLVAWVVASPGHEPAPGELRAFAARKLPASMVPAAIMLLPELPRTANGKVDRRALPQPLPTSTAPFVPPGTAVEERLAAIWAEVLQVERVGIHDDFFELGGHSLAANQVLSRVCSAFRIKLPLRALLEVPTVAGLEIAIARELLRQPGAETAGQALIELGVRLLT